jgi:hypothetical protein
MSLSAAVRHIGSVVAKAGRSGRAFRLGPVLGRLAPSWARPAIQSHRVEPIFLDRGELVARQARLGPARWLAKCFFRGEKVANWANFWPVRRSSEALGQATRTKHEAGISLIAYSALPTPALHVPPPPRWIHHRRPAAHASHCFRPRKLSAPQAAASAVEMIYEVAAFVLSTNFILSYRHLFLIGGNIMFTEI